MCGSSCCLSVCVFMFLDVLLKVCWRRWHRFMNANEETIWWSKRATSPQAHRPQDTLLTLTAARCPWSRRLLPSSHSPTASPSPAPEGTVRFQQITAPRFFWLSTDAAKSKKTMHFSLIFPATPEPKEKQKNIHCILYMIEAVTLTCRCSMTSTEEWVDFSGRDRW